MNDRRAELIAAAASHDLTDAEHAELRALAADDPTVDDEIDDFRRTVDRLAETPPVLPWDNTQPSPALRQRVLGSLDTDTDTDTDTRTTSLPARSRRGARQTVLAGAAAAVVGIAVGAGAVLGAGGSFGEDAASERTVTGPPGTLGAYEELAFVDTPAGIDIEGGLVPHTWGTETVLEMAGIPERGTYGVYVLAESGATIPSGSFLGSSVTIDCRMNAAVDRADVRGVEIRDVDGTVLARADVADTA